MGLLLVVSAYFASTKGFTPKLAGGPSVTIRQHTASSCSRVTQCQMFTGIVEEMGEVIDLQQRDDMTLWDGSKGAGTELTVKADIALEGAYLG